MLDITYDLVAKVEADVIYKLTWVLEANRGAIFDSHTIAL